MEKIFFFKKRDPATGELTNEIVEADERIAWNYWNKPRFFKLLGWSDGSAMKAVFNELHKVQPSQPRDKETGMALPLSEEWKLKIREAKEQEIQKGMKLRRDWIMR